ncbi:MAG: CapA family protein, partial [Spirochaetaceae bacterium]|nr:CapA family protein [Spirochaetaceae bacterium]
EYTPSRRQEELARFLAERGVDLVIGHHPHVLQPLRALPREAASPMVCFFSLGNFLSAQDEPPRLLGGMMRVLIKKEASGTVSVESTELIPLVTHYEAGYTNFSVNLLRDYTEELAARHRLYRKKGYTGPDYFHDLIKKVFGDYSIYRDYER